MDKILKIQTALEAGKLSHALMLECFDGSEGYFTELFRSFLCARSGLKPCMKCDSCLTPLNLTDDDRKHPDFFFARPAGEVGYTVEQVRDWGSQFIYLSKNLAPRKLLVIQNAEKLSGAQQAPANALLKILEEPRADIFLILMTSKPYKLIATVRSRCLKISFRQETKRIDAGLLPEDESVLEELMQLFEFPALAGRSFRSQLSNPTWWKNRAARIEILEDLHLRAWNLLKNKVESFSREEALTVWTRWKHFEDFLVAVKLYGNPPLHWLNLKRKVKGELSWRMSKLFG